MYQEEVKEQLYQTIVHKRREWLPLPGPKRPLVRRFPMPETQAEVISEIDEVSVAGVDEDLAPQEPGPEPEESTMQILEPFSTRPTAPERSMETLGSACKSGPMIDDAANTSEASVSESPSTLGSELPARTPITPNAHGRGLCREGARGASFFAKKTDCLSITNEA